MSVWAKLLGTLAIIALAAGLFFGIQWAYESWRGTVHAEGDKAGAARVQKQFDAYRIQAESEAREAAQETQRLSGRMAATAAQGERDAIQKAEAAATAARGDHELAAATGRGLLGDIAGLNAAATAAGVPDAATCPAELVRERAAAVRARDLLGACSSRYRELAAAADDAFTAVTLRLDTAMSYIQALQSAPP